MANKLNQYIFEKLLGRRRVKDYFAMLSSNIALRPVQLVKEYMVARYLGPADYGLLKSIEIIQMLNKYGNIGFKSVAIREAGDAIGKKDIELSYQLRGAAYAGEIILTSTIFIIGLLSSLIFSDFRISLLIVLVSFSFFAAKMQGLFSTEALIHKDFQIIARINFLAGLIGSLIIIGLVPFYNIYIVVLMQFLVGTVTVISYLTVTPYRLRLNFNKTDIKNATRIGFPLAVNVLVQGGFKYSERLIVLIHLGQVSLGIYSFALVISDQLFILFKLLINVRAQDIFEMLGMSNYSGVHNIVLRETKYMLLAALLIYPFYYYSIELFLPIILPEWSVATDYAQLFYFLIPIQSVSLYTQLVISSSTVDEQRQIPLTRFISLVVLYILFIGYTISSELDIISFIVMILISYLSYSVIMTYVYYNKYYKIYIKN